MTDIEEKYFNSGQWTMAVTFIRELYRYIPECDRGYARNLLTISDCRNKVKQIFEYMDEEYPADWDDLYLADVLDKLLDRVACLVDSMEPIK